MGKDTETRMRELEYFRGLRLVPGAWTNMQLNGRGFTRFTAGRFDKPFDIRLRDFMTGAARSVMEEFQGLYAVTHSDEIPIMFPPKWDMFDRRLEKLVSISAGLASASFAKPAARLPISTAAPGRASVSKTWWTTFAGGRQRRRAAPCIAGATARCGRTAWTAKRRRKRCEVRAKFFRTNCSSGTVLTSTICPPGNAVVSACIGKAIKNPASIRCEVSQSQLCGGASESMRSCRWLKPMRSSCAGSCAQGSSMMKKRRPRES